MAVEECNEDQSQTGLLDAAYMTVLVTCVKKFGTYGGYRPGNFIYDKAKMRFFLTEYSRSGRGFLEFLKSGVFANVSDANVHPSNNLNHVVKVHCVCRLTENDKMLCCDSCKVWFHHPCSRHMYAPELNAEKYYHEFERIPKGRRFFFVCSNCCEEKKLPIEEEQKNAIGLDFEEFCEMIESTCDGQKEMDDDDFWTFTSNVSLLPHNGIVLRKINIARLLLPSTLIDDESILKYGKLIQQVDT